MDVNDQRIANDFADPYLELIYLLNQGAGLEQSLMLSYLYAAFSLKDDYADLRGALSRRSYEEHDAGGSGGSGQLLKDASMLDVCIEEMQHLATVNTYLVAIGSSPSFTTHLFPYSGDLYPFALDLLPLDRYVAATYMWVEADACALSRQACCAGKGEPPAFKLEVHKVLQEGARRHHNIPIDDEPLSHLGSLYRKVLRVTQRLADRPPPALPGDFPWGKWEERLHWLLYQGEMAHYQLFKSIYTGEAFGAGPSIWDDPRDPRYPSRPLRRGTAFRGHRRTIDDSDAREIAWLSDLHYWILLALLDVAYRYADDNDNIQRKYKYKATGVMTGNLWALGLDLARRGWGLPFDQMSAHYALGRTQTSALTVAQLLTYEARALAQRLASRGLLPADYSMSAFEFLLDGLLAPPAG